jgi:hypothetical protein
MDGSEQQEGEAQQERRLYGLPAAEQWDYEGKVQ